MFSESSQMHLRNSKSTSEHEVSGHAASEPRASKAIKIYSMSGERDVWDT